MQIVIGKLGHGLNVSFKLYRDSCCLWIDLFRSGHDSYLTKYIEH